MILVANGIPCRKGRKLTDGIVYSMYKIVDACEKQVIGQTRQGEVRGGRLRLTEVYLSWGTWCYVEYSIFPSLTDIHYTYLLCIIPSHIRIHIHPDRTSRRSNRIYTTI